MWQQNGNIIHVLKKCISTSVATVLKCMKWLYPYVIGIWCQELSKVSTPVKRSETIPSSRITPDPLDSQLHVGAPSLQFTHSFSTGFSSEEWIGHSRSLVLCSLTHFCVVFEVYVWIIVWLEIQTWPIIRFPTESVTYWFFICWYLIESVMRCV